MSQRISILRIQIIISMLPVLLLNILVAISHNGILASIGLIYTVAWAISMVLILHAARKRRQTSE